MSWYLKAMEEQLSEYDKKVLKSIQAPRVVAVQPTESYNQSCVMPDGEIRIYGWTIGRGKACPNGGRGYISSRDCGLSWEQHYSWDTMGPASYNPETGRWLNINGDGLRIRISDIGPDDKNPRYIVPISGPYGCPKIPFILKHKKRWVTTYHRDTEIDGRANFLPVFVYSDDDGETWHLIELPVRDNSEVIYPDKGSRWLNRGSEPTVAELKDGTLLLFARTSDDFMHVYRSHDHGDTWEGGENAPLHGTLTTPVMKNLSDGRILLMWNNTMTMPKHNHYSDFPCVHHGHVMGNFEDVFTNRDVCHAAVTEDGEHWVGMREALLTSIRNDADYRRAGGRHNIGDKSLQQFEIWELPYNKVLVVAGQSIAARRVFIMGLDWLYETERMCDFQNGLDDVTTHQYLKSIPGSWFGHDTWNRTAGASMAPDPAGIAKEGIVDVAQICRYHDERLYNEKQGLCWNFPASGEGTVEMDIRIDGAGVGVSLSDFWMNPSDPTMAERQPMYFTLENTDMTPEQWHRVRIVYSTSRGRAEIYTDEFEKPIFAARFNREMPVGVSYIHLQSLAEEPDFKGTYLKYLSKKN